MTEKEQAIEQLRELKRKQERCETLEVLMDTTRKKIENGLSSSELPPLDLLPTNKAGEYLRSQTSGIKNRSELKALIVKILFWIVAVAAVLVTGFLVYDQIARAGKLMFLLLPAGSLVSILIGFLALRFRWRKRILIAIVCTLALGVTAHFTQMYLNFLVWIFLGVVLLAVGLVALCLHFNGWERFFYFHNTRINRVEKKVRKSKEYKEKSAEDQKNTEENNRRRAVFNEEKTKREEAKRQLLREEISQYAREQAQFRQALRENGVLEYEKLSMIDRLIEKLQQSDANTVAEAMRLCEESDAALARMIAKTDMEIWQQKQQQQKAFDQWCADYAHQKKVEYEQEKQRQALEDIKEALEEINRHGR